MKEVYFDGFQKECIDFLWELRMNNNKEWFDNNKKRYYDYLKEPMDVFARELNKGLCSLLGDNETTAAVSRINRDVRFSKNKAPYKDRKWIVFRFGEGRWQQKPCYFFELCPEGYCYGVGFYEGDATFMQNYRAKIDANPANAERLFKSMRAYKEFLLEGESFKKKFNGIHGGELGDWYTKKSVALVKPYEFSEVIFTRELLDDVLEGYNKMLPLYRFLREMWE